MRHSRFSSILFLALAIAIPAAPRAMPGQQSGPAKPKARKKLTPPPRAIAVLEWVPADPSQTPPATVPNASASGPKLTVSDPNAHSAAVDTITAPSKVDPPKEARLVPVSIFYDGVYQDAGVYLSRPAPLALQADTVYDLEKSGDPAGTFTLQSASRKNDAWLAAGNYKPVPPPQAYKPNVSIALGPNADDDSDRPVLKRRHPDGDDSAAQPAAPAATAKPATARTDNPVGSDDPDRPRLHRAPSAEPAATTAPATSSNPAAQPAQPGIATNPRTSDDYLNPEDDPSRPHIRRGTYREQNPPLPSLLDNATNIRQTVAVSDAAHTDDHTFSHLWNNDDERSRAKQAMQQLALAQIQAWQKKSPSTHDPHPPTSRKSRAQSQPDLAAVQFAAFDLAFQDEPTYVFTAQTPTGNLAQIFVVVVARPDIYGNLQVVFSSVTNGSQLALAPRYRLVDAVDANGDGRAELLFESRNLEGRRFLLMDVYRGQAEKVFETGLLP